LVPLRPLPDWLQITDFIKMADAGEGCVDYVSLAKEIGK